MLTLKSHLICSYCAKIIKEPIELPCEDSICREHLSERNVVKENRIKCKKCKQDFGVRDNQFNSNKTLRSLIESQCYLSEEESSLKKELEESIRTFFVFYDKFVQNKSILESNVYDHFQEIRFQIDEQRERIKERIDDIALAMIGDTKTYEALYLSSIKEKLFQTQSFESLEKELNGIEETFRNPNLLIQTIREMQQKQDESLKNIQLKLNEMNQVRDHLKATNEFQSNSTSFNQNETSLFGSIKFSLYSNLSLFKSEILKGEKQYFDLIELCEFCQNDKWSLLYRGTRDGFSNKAFHSKCDGHSNTLTILKANGSGFIFGGFTTVDWEACEWPGESKSDPNAFLFSLTNKENKPLKMKVDPNRHQYAIYCGSGLGPTFGAGCDIVISNNKNTTMNGSSNLGRTYKHPQYEFGTNEAKTFLAGSFEFQLAEIEVYQKE
jgi:5-methylcytosine-specific restriction endonuclease McrA